MNDDGKSVFARYIESPEPERVVPEVIRMGPAAATIPPASPKAPLSEKFLSWLINDWPKPTVSLREICRYAPPAGRDWERGMSLAETAVQRGWLVRLETRRRDMRVWEIQRGSSR